MLNRGFTPILLRRQGAFFQSKNHFHRSFRVCEYERLRLSFIHEQSCFGIKSGFQPAYGLFECQDGKLLSLSFWRDEAALQSWRRLREHRLAQAMGRNRMFEDYRLRVAEVVRDYGKLERAEAPADSRAAHGG